MCYTGLQCVKFITTGEAAIHSFIPEDMCIISKIHKQNDNPEFFKYTMFKNANNPVVGGILQ